MRIIKKLLANLVVRLVVILFFVMAVFGYAGGRFIFVEANSDEVNIYPGNFRIEQAENEFIWQAPENVFFQDLDAKASFNKFNPENSGFISLRTLEIIEITNDDIATTADEIATSTNQDVLPEQPFPDPETTINKKSPGGEFDHNADDPNNSIAPEEDESIIETLDEDSNLAEEESVPILESENTDFQKEVEIIDISNEPESTGEVLDDEASADNSFNSEFGKSAETLPEEQAPIPVEQIPEPEPIPADESEDSTTLLDKTIDKIRFLSAYFGFFRSKLARAQEEVINFIMDEPDEESSSTVEVIDIGQITEAAGFDLNIVTDPIKQSLIFSDFAVPTEYHNTEIKDIKLRVSLAARSDYVDDRLIFEYKLDGAWRGLGKLQYLQDISNALNNDYFEFALPDGFTWESMSGLEIKISYNNNNIADPEESKSLEVYLDALWLEINHGGGIENIIQEDQLELATTTEEELSEEKEDISLDFELNLLSFKEHFKIGETPEFRFQFRKKRGFMRRIGAEILGLFRDEYEDIKISAEIFDSDGKGEPRAGFRVQYLAGGEFEFRLDSKPRQFKPGRYTVKFNILSEILTGGRAVSFTQSFTWGVLAYNSNKSIYLKDEAAYLQMGVLDDDGNTLCDAELILEIDKPGLGGAILSTKNGSITKNPECGPNNVIDTPDYYAYYDISKTGTYDIKLTAVTKNGRREITDSFEVRNKAPFEIERIGPTRIYPWADYTMRFNIKANEDYSGNLVEYMPVGFKVVRQYAGRKELFNFKDNISVTGEDKLLLWPVDFKAGEEYTFSYIFDAPNISPEFYLLGPLTISIANRQSSIENRMWQIAGDADNEIDHTYFNVNGQLNQTLNFTTDGWWERTEYQVASTSFTAGDKYLIAISVAIQISDNNANGMARVRHGATQFDDSEWRWENRRNNVIYLGHNYEYFTVWEAVAGEDINFDISIAGAVDYEVRLSDYEFMAINLSQDLTEDIDWFFATSTHSGNLPNGSWDAGYSITFDGGGNDWMVLGLGRFLADNTSADFLMRLNNTTDGLTYSQVRYETEDGADYRPTMIMAGTTLTGIKTWRVEAQVDTATTHDWSHSSIFALNVSNFQDHFVSYDTSSVLVTPVDTWVQATTTNYTVTETGDHFIWSMEIIDTVENTKNVGARIQVDGVTVPTGHDDHQKVLPHGVADENSIHSLYSGTMATGTRQIDIDLWEEQDVATPPDADIRSLVIFSMELAPVLPPAPGDYMVRSNVAETDAILFSATDFGWDTLEAATGTSIRYANDIFVLAQGKYLISWGEYLLADDATDNERHYIMGNLVVGGAATTTCGSSGFIRKVNGNQETYPSGMCILQIESDNTTLKTRMQRWENSAVIGNVNRVAGYGGISILALDDTHLYARYGISSSQAIGDEVSSINVNWDYNIEEDTGFSRTNDAITIPATAGRYFVSYTLHINNGSGNNRAQYTARLSGNAADIAGTQTACYLRGRNTDEDIFDTVCQWGGLVDLASGDVLRLNVTHEDGETDAANIEPGSAIEIWQLPAGAETIIVRATTGTWNPTSETDFAWDTTPQISTDTFTYTNGNTNIDVDAAGDYFFTTSLYTNNDDPGNRAMPRVRFRIQNTATTTVAGCYDRGLNESMYCGFGLGKLLPNLSINDSIEAATIETGQGDVGTLDMDFGSFTAFSLSSVFAAASTDDVTVSATGTQVSTMDINSTDNYVGGVFVLTENNATSSVTSITITEAGTVDASSSLTNIRLYYDLDTTAPYDCASVSFSLGDSRFGATSTKFSSANGTSTFSGSVEISTTSTMCVYAVLDVGSGASLDETMEIEINDPSADVVLSSGTVDPATSIELSGTTTLYAPNPTATANEQYRSDIFTAITNQGWTDENQIFLYATADDINATDTTAVDLYYELKEEGGSFTTATTAPVSSCSSGAAYGACSDKIWTISDSASTSSWYHSNWLYRKKITINANQVSTTTANFPVLATTTDSLFAHTSYGGHMSSSTGADIVITDSDGLTALSYEREYYSSSTGEIALWIKTNISSVVNKDLYIYYGNSTVSTDQSTTTGVWDDNFIVVQHLKETSGTHYDSTKNSYNGTPTFDGTGTQDANGQIGGADYFDDTNDQISLTSFNLPDTVTITAWMNTDTVVGDNGVVGKDSSLTFKTNGTELRVTWPGASDQTSSGAALSTTPWTYVGFTYDLNLGSNQLKFYKDGSNFDSNTYSNSFTQNANPVLIANNQWNQYFFGTIDEVRVSNVVRTPGWIQTEYNNQRDVSGFLSFASTEETKDAIAFDGTVNITSIPDRGSSTDSTLGYKWQILACNNSSECSVWSGFNSILPNFKVDTIPPGAPGNLTLATTTPTTITLDFNSQTDEINFSDYKIFYKDGIAGVDTDDTEHNDPDLDYIDYNSTATTTITGLESDTQYVINIWAYDLAGNKTGATEIVVTTQSAPHARARSVQFLAGDYSSSDGLTGQDSNTDQVFSTFNWQLAEIEADIRSAYVLYEAQFEAYHNNSGNYTGYELAFDTCAEPCTAVATSGSGRVLIDDNSVLAYNEDDSNQVRILLDVTNEIQLAAYTGDGANMEAQISYRLETGSATTSIGSARAVLVITYTFNDDDSTNITNTVIYPLDSDELGDSGTRRSSAVDNCTKSPLGGSDCPLFDYNMDIPELSSKLAQWFRLYGVNDGHGTNDIKINVNIEGTNIDSGNFYNESANGGEQGNLPRIIIDNVSGYSESTDQKFEYYLDSGGGATYYMLGGEVIETYTASKSAGTKTRTVSFPVGVITNGQSISTASGSVNVYFPENGSGSGVVDIKKAWFRVINNNYNSGAYTLTVSSKVGDNSQSGNYIYNIDVGDETIKPSYNVIHIIPSGDYTELESANKSTAKEVVIYTTNSSVNMGGVSAELMITYAYTDESSGYLTSLNLFGGQSDIDGNSTSDTETIAQSVFPELRGTETVRAAGMLGSFLVSDSDGDMPGAWFTLDINMATASPVCDPTGAFGTRADAMNSFTEYYKDVTSALFTTDNQSYTACYKNDNSSDATAGAKMNAILLYTYQWDAPPPEFTQNDWRWYENKDNKQPDMPLAAENIVITNVNLGDVIRVRMNIGVTKSELATSTNTFKLQYAMGTDCTAIASTSWGDVGGIAGAEDWRGYNNPDPADGAALDSVLLSSSIRPESYEEENYSISNPSSVPNGGYGEWDWMLYNNSATSSTGYCFRMVKSNGAELDDYLSDSYPKLTTAPTNTGADDPSSLGQFRNDGTTAIANLSWVNEASVKLNAAATDPNMSERISLFFELASSTASFTTATSQPASFCFSGTGYYSCASRIWAATSTLGDYRTAPFTGTTTISGIPDYNGYKWQVLACDDDSECSDWVIFNATTPNFKVDNTPPTAPGNLQFSTSTPTSITLNFGASTTEDNFDTYRIYYRAGIAGVTESDTEHTDNNSLPYQDYNSTSSTIVINLSANTKYVFNIWAYDAAGNKATATLEVVGTTTSAFNPPTGFIVDAGQKTDGSGVVDITILANDPDNDDTLRAKIMYKSGAGCDFTSGYSDPAIDETNANISATYSDPDADNNYEYQVGTSTSWIITSPGQNYVLFDWLSASDLVGVEGTYCLGLVVNDGQFDQTATHTKTLTIDTKDPSQPGWLELNSRNYNSVTLNFGTTSSDTNFKEYKIFYKIGITGVTESDSEWNQTDDPNLGSANYGGAATTTITGLNPNTDYVFNIWAYDDYGNKASSSYEITVKTNATPVNISADGQYRDDGVTVIANNSWIDENNVIIKASAHDQDAGDLLTFYYELITATGTLATATTVPPDTCSYGIAYNTCSSKIWATATTSSELPAGWYSEDWLYRKAITINASQVESSETGVTILATTTDSDLASYARSDGYDILFTDSTGTTTLSYEREYYNNSTGELVVWIKSDISSTTDTTLYMYYGNSAQSTDMATTTGTWVSSYRGVWHLKENVVDESSASNAHPDSTINTNYGYQYGNNETSAWIYQGQEFDGIDDFIDIGDTNSNINTISFWIKADNGNGGIIDLDGGVSTITLVDNVIRLDGFSNPIFYTDGIATSTVVRYYKQITIYASQVSTTTSNFPVLATTTDSDLKYISHGGHVASSTGGDIYFTASDGETILDYEWEYYSSSTGELVAWIETDISTAIDTVIYIYYGDSTVSTDQSTTTGVWDDDFIVVQHFEETSGTHYDSKNNYNGTPTFDGTGTQDASGQINGADYFDGTNDQVSITSFNLPNTVTVTAWINADSISGEHGIVSKSSSFTFKTSGTELRVTWPGASDQTSSGAALSTAPWTFVGFTYDLGLGSNQLKFYKNGSNFDSNTYLNGFTQNANSVLIANNEWSQYFNGTIDDVKVSSVVRTPGWIQTEYDNQRDVGSFMSFGSEQSVKGSSLIDTNWHHITITTDTAIDAANLDIGRVSSNYFDGILDEVEISGVAASSSLIKTQYNNQNDVNSFLSFAAGQSTVTSYFESTLIVTIPDNPDYSTGYKWQVMACDDDSDCTGWDAFNATTPNFKIDTTDPTAPGALTENTKTSNSITLNFGAQTSEDNFVDYKIFYSTSSPVYETDTEYDDSDLDYINYNSTSNTTVNGLNPSTTYYFNIWAYDVVGRKASSSITSITTNVAMSTPGVIFYAKNDRQIYYRVWDSIDWGAEQSSGDITAVGDNIRHIRAIRSDDGGKVGLLFKTWDGTNQEWWGTVYRYAANDFVGSLQLGAAEADATNNQIITGCIASLSGSEFMIIRNNNTADGTLVYSWNPVDGWITEVAGSDQGAVLNGCELVRRPNTDNYLLMTFDDDGDVGSAYYYGDSAYVNSWTAWTEHSTDEEDYDNYVGEAFFDPSDNTRGALYYSNSAANNYAYAKYFINDNTSINYGGTQPSPATGSEDWGSDFAHGEFASDPGGTGIAYFTGRDITGELNVYQLDVTNPTISWATTTNGDNISLGLLYPETNDAQKPFAISFYESGKGVVTWADANTTAPVYKVFNASTNALDAATTSVPGADNNNWVRVRFYNDPAVDETVAIYQNDDIDYAAVFFNGGTDAFYSAGNQAWNELVTASGAFDRDDENTSYAFTGYNSAPNTPASLEQYKSDASTTIANQAWTDESTVKFEMSVTDYDTSEIITFYLELLANNDTFSTSTVEPVSPCASSTPFDVCSSKIWAVASSSASDYSYTPFTATATITNIASSTVGYKWQVLACDDNSACSSWVEYNATQPNFYVDNETPSPPGALTVASKTSNTVTINFGVATDEPVVSFSTYRIYYSSSTPVTVTDMEHVDADLGFVDYNSTTDTIITGLASSTLYYFNIWAYDLAGNISSSTIAATTTSASANLAQTSFLLENDDGVNVNSNTAEVAASTTLSNINLGERINARIQIENNGGDIASNKVYKLQFENQTDNPGVWADVGASTEISYNLGLSGANNDSITSEKVANPTKFFIFGSWHENVNTTANFDLSNGEFTEFVFMVETSNAATNTTYRLRLYNNTDTAPLNSYSNYPIISTITAEIKRYSKGPYGSLLGGTNDLTYYFDPEGYADILSDDNNRDAITVNNYPVYNFATKHVNNTDAASSTWNGQSSVAASTNNVFLQVYHFGSTNNWVTIATNTTAAADTDFSLIGGVNSNLSEYYTTGNWIYWRIYQESGSQTLRSDYYTVNFAPPVPNTEQIHYRWRNDDGSEITATWLEAEDTGSATLGPELGKGSSTRLRLAVANTGGGDAANYNYRLEYASTTDGCVVDFGAWTVLPVAATTEHFEMDTSANFADGDPTTATMSNPEGYNFVAGDMVEDPSNSTGNITTTEGDYSEVEYMILVTNNAVDATSYCFWVTNSGTVLNTYGIYPAVTLSGNTNNAPTFTTDPSDGGSASTSPTNYGNNVSFSGTATDSDGNDYYLAVCQTNSISSGLDAAPTCDGGEWCISAQTVSGAGATCDYITATTTEVNAWYAFACDKISGFGIAKCSAMSQGGGSVTNDSPFVVNNLPVFTSVLTTDDNKDPGGTFWVTAYATDADTAGTADTLRLHVCTTNSASFAGCGDGTYCSETVSSSPNASCSFATTTPATAGDFTYYAFVYDSHGLAAADNSRTNTYTINNVTPTIGTLLLNDGNNIMLNLKDDVDTIISSISVNIQDLNGCDDLDSVVGAIYMSNVSGGYNCSDDDNNCYQIPYNTGATTECTIECAGWPETAATTTCTAEMKYFAVPTDAAYASNPWKDYHWMAYINLNDGVNLENATSSGVEVLTSLALAVVEATIDFGALEVGQNTGTLNSTSTVENAGNSPIDADIAGIDMDGAPLGTLDVNQIKYNTVNFDYVFETNALDTFNQFIEIIAPRATSTSEDKEDDVLWGIGIPFDQDPADYEGQNTFTVRIDVDDW